MDTSKIIELYVEEKLSTKAIAERYNTYPNKIRRVLLSNGVEIRTKSQAQKQALENGSAVHPTKGKKRSEEAKDKISSSLEKHWDAMSEQERNRRSALAKKHWDSLSESERKEIQRKGSEALRETIRDGSKAERSLLQNLKNIGYTVELHKKGLISGEKYEMDLYLPDIDTIIEIDGPQHFMPVFGEKHLREYVKHDAIKNGIMIKNGYCVIRVKYLCPSFTRGVENRLWEMVEPVVKQVATKFPPKSKRLIELEIS
jgi:very-short-patch-repair endonuclease|tara:strand:- start:1343 stop:2113 length:771 start_codon:yes stop_codon:yes gene_type:complete